MHNVSSIIKPCRMTILLEPPGSGKITLLLALAGKLDSALKLRGVNFNGHDINEFVPQRTSAYIGQHDLHIGEMTVRETLAFSARCQGVLDLGGEDIIAVLPWDEWWHFELNRDDSNPQIALLPLHPDIRAKFNTTAAWEYAINMSGKPYGYHNMIFNYENYPPPLDAHLLVSLYCINGKQFGAPLAAFQINQEKLVRMLGNIQAMLLVGWCLCKLYESGKMTFGHARMGKAWISLRARETVALGRELVGGNRILSDFLVAKAFCDWSQYIRMKELTRSTVWSPLEKSPGLLASNLPCWVKQVAFDLTGRLRQQTSIFMDQYLADSEV